MHGKKMRINFIMIGSLLCIMWTGILVAALCGQLQTVKNLQCIVIQQMEKIGMHPFMAAGILQDRKERNEAADMIFRQNDMLKYLYSNEQRLVKVTDSTVTRLAGHFAGQNKENNLFWSTAGSIYDRSEVLFETKDENGQQAVSKEETQTQTRETTAQVEEHKASDTPISKTPVATDSKEKLQQNLHKIEKLEKSMSRSYLLKNFYITDSSTTIDNSIFQVRTLLTKSMVIKKEKKPQILIFHTHGASESFRDSKKGRKEDSIVGVGAALAKELTDTYGYRVIHDQTQYDRINGKIDRSLAYNYSCKGVTETLKKYPSIQVVIDLHRDGVGNKVKRTTVVDGKKTAQIMFFNGLSRNASGNISYLQNKNLQGNLSFSLQLKLVCMRRFQNLAKPIYLKGYRYNMHLKERFTLIELGNENNTLQEQINATKPLAMILDCVLQGKK